MGVLVAATLLGAAPTAAHAASSDITTLTVGFVHGVTTDRVTITSTGAVPPLSVVDDAEPPINIGKGQDHPILGATYYIHLDGIAGVDLVTAPRPATTGNVVDTFSQVFEAEVTINVGLRRAAPYAVSRDEHHLYIDVAH
jgi:hypothetical protein